MKTNHAEDMREEYDFSQGKRGAVLPHAGKTRITIWIDTDILDWFRALADREGRGYQTALNTALHHYTQQNARPLLELVRDVIREELRTFHTESTTPAEPVPAISHNGNAVLQEVGEQEQEAPESPARRGVPKLTPRQLRAMRAKRARGVPIKALMEQYGLSKATVFRYLAQGSDTRERSKPKHRATSKAGVR